MHIHTNVHRYTHINTHVQTYIPSHTHEQTPGAPPAPYTRPAATLQTHFLTQHANARAVFAPSDTSREGEKERERDREAVGQGGSKRQSGDVQGIADEAAPEVCRSVLQCVAVCCSVLQCVAVCCVAA